LNNYYDSRELDLIGHDVSFAIEDAEEKLRKLGVPQPELVAMKLAIVSAVSTLPELPYTFGAKLSQIREIKEQIDRLHDALQKQANKELQSSKHTNVVYVDFNKGREI
jgi:23S rRNA maturation-related 3'-5' exoribonuclease YhaM